MQEVGRGRISLNADTSNRARHIDTASICSTKPDVCFSWLTCSVRQEKKEKLYARGNKRKSQSQRRHVEQSQTHWYGKHSHTKPDVCFSWLTCSVRQGSKISCMKEVARGRVSLNTDTSNRVRHIGTASICNTNPDVFFSWLTCSVRPKYP